MGFTAAYLADQMTPAAIKEVGVWDEHWLLPSPDVDFILKPAEDETYGKDIFGFKPTLPRRLGGPFGDELIAGGFIQRFSLFSFFQWYSVFNLR